jgi:hypothetical protein
MGDEARGEIQAWANELRAAAKRMATLSGTKMLRDVSSRGKALARLVDPLVELGSSAHRNIT